VKETGKNKPGEQKKGELEKARGPGKGRKNKKTKAHPGGSRTAIGVDTNGRPQNRKIGWCVGGGGGGGGGIPSALLRAFFTFSPSKEPFFWFFSPNPP